MEVQIIRSLKEDSNTKSGIGYYADFLEEQLGTKGNKIDPVCFELNFDHGFKNFLINNIARSIIDIIRGRKNVDVVHATAEHCAIFLPFAKARRIVTFHHVMKNNEADTNWWGIIWRLSVLISKIYANEFIAISPLTKKEMIEVLNIPEEKITVAMHPPNSEMHRGNILKEDIVSFVGSFTDRKNPSAAVRVFKRMQDIPDFKKYELIMCGTGPKIDAIKGLVLELGLKDSVHFINNLSVEELRSLYGRCRFLLNTSTFEGLGITTLESQMCGTPVLYFEDANMPPEVMVAAISCQDVDDMAIKALELIKDEERMKRTIEEGIAYANNFGKDYVEKLEVIYKKNNRPVSKTP